MAKRANPKDLFGDPIPTRRPRYEASLERLDRATLPARAARVRWLSQVIPKNIGFLMPTETHYVFDGAKSAFVQGNFVAVIVLSSAFVDHWFAAGLARHGSKNKAKGTLESLIKLARAEKLADETLLQSADRLRLIRNPFVHLKPFDH
jgi:hypothetical protein